MRIAHLAFLAATPLLNAQDPVDFDRDVRPILSANCFQCHGPDAGHRKAKLRLDQRDGLFGERKHGRVVVPGAPQDSLMIARIRHADAKKRMPPQDSGRELSESDKDLLTRWIAEGAHWQTHWAFVPPQRPEVPAAGGWGHNAIDAFVAARLRAEGLQPSPEAEPRELIRRVTLDLTGLPPTLADVEAFVADRSADAYERLVDRLLGSPHYGEHQARFWLDAARYGDTHGLHLDNYREMWPYRDAVIDAFNRNQPFDQFVVEQLAGDLLPDATLPQRIASGFNRCHVTTAEGGSIEEEVYVRNVIDRVSTTGTVFLGLTVGCAVCHDHKFDPISQREFYQLFAFFNNLDGAPMDGNAKAPPPFVRVPSDEQTARMREIDAAIAALDAEIAAELARVEYEEPARTATPAAPRHEVVWIDDALPDGAQPEGDGLVWVEAPHEPVHSGRRSMRRSSQGNQQHFFRNATRKLRIAAGDRLFAWVRLDPASPPREIMLQFNDNGSDGWQHRAYWGENLIGYGTDDSSERRRLGDLPQPGEWVRLEIDVATIGLAPGMVVHGAAFTQFDGTAYWDTVGIETSAPQEPEDFAWIDDDVPSGAVLNGDGKTWQWVGGEGQPVHSGLRSLRRSGGNGLNQDYFTGAQPLRLQAGDRLFAHVWLDPDDPPRSVQLQWNDGTWEHRARWGEGAHGAGRPGGADFVAGPLPATGAWVRLEVDLADVGLKPGAKLNGQAFTQVGGTVYWDRAGVRTWGPPDDRHLQSQLAWERLAVGDDSVPKGLREIAALEPARRSAEQQRQLRDHYLRHVFSGTRQTFDALESRLAQLHEERQQTEDAMPTTLVMQERNEPREAFVLRRGQYDAKGEQVERQTPAVLPPMDPDLPRNRLGLARWLVDPSQPLTARVAVNRFWQHLFGTGLVKTSEDFGSQGEPPSHPLLLDWLATQFVADGWNVKQTLRRMVLSATYRQSSRLTPALLARDPDNRLLARGPHQRLDAEVLRDQALAVGGLLQERIGGPSVKPPQPEGLWEAVGYVGSNTAKFTADKGAENVHRRSLYTFWKRTSAPPEMTTFDAPSRESCMVRRERTNTPLQALLLLNDPQYLECARGLAERAVHEGGTDASGRASYAFALATARQPAADELAELVDLYRDQLATFGADPEAARKLVTVGETPPDPDLDTAELAAWTMVGNVILNLDEVVTKR